MKEQVPYNKFKKQGQTEEDLVPEPVCEKDIEEAIKTTKKSPGLETKKYLKWVEEFGSV